MLHKFYFILIFLISLSTFLFCQVESTIPEIEKKLQEVYTVSPGIWMPDSMSEKDEKETLKKYDKSTKIYLDILKDYNKNKYYRYLNEGRFQLYNLSEDFANFNTRNERSKKILELNIQTDALGAKYQKVSDSEKANLKNELKNKLNELFELKEKERKEEYENLRKRLDDLKVTLDERQKFKEEIIKRKLEELIGESKHIQW